MTHVLLIQLPVPQLNFGHQTGNIPFGAACLYQASNYIKDITVDIMPQALATYAGDRALLSYISRMKPDIIGFTCYLWNIQRTLYMCRQIKKEFNPRIVLGGPEITPDNNLVQDTAVDFYAYGEGEDLFIQLLNDPDRYNHHSGHGSGTPIFSTVPSPYFTAPLSPDLESIMLLETMRGCPYKCAFCFYNKSHDKMVFKEDRLVLEGLSWARENNIREVYFLDPSINSRPGLKDLLTHIADINHDQKLSLISEIRVEAVDEELAVLMAKAGFSWLEVGLQSTNPSALKAMNRKTDLSKFVKGAHALMKNNITPAIDLIVGLPGDDLVGFEKTVAFVKQNGLHEDIQVFPLSLIPGTEFRTNHLDYGLTYDPNPPYTVISTATFPEEDMLEAFDIAEEMFDISLYPYPDLDIAYKTQTDVDISKADDITVQIAGETLFRKIVIKNDRSDIQLAQTARQVTHPYQLLVPPDTGFDRVSQALSTFTSKNPHTPLEVIFYEPRELPDMEDLLKHDKLERPSYLDNDLRLLYPDSGNRSILFTVVSKKTYDILPEPMIRHIYWWKENSLPSKKYLQQLEVQGYEGVLLDPPAPSEKIRLIHRWQDDMIGFSGETILIAFAWTHLHKRWIEKTCAEDYCTQILI